MDSKYDDLLPPRGHDNVFYEMAKQNLVFTEMCPLCGGDVEGRIHCNRYTYPPRASDVMADRTCTGLTINMEYM